MEQRREKTGRISLEDQCALRDLLRSHAEDALQVRARIIAILNPREAPVVHLTDEQFTQLYHVTNEDNFDLRDTVIEDIYAVFDADHGFYVASRRRWYS